MFFMGWFREWWREERERCGLLRVLLSELEHNAEVVRTVWEGTWDLLSSPDLPSLRTETWRNVQGRAAALLPGYLAAPLNGYYSALHTLLTLLAFEKRANEHANREIRRAYSELTGKEVVGARNPWDTGGTGFTPCGRSPRSWASRRSGRGRHSARRARGKRPLPTTRSRKLPFTSAANVSGLGKGKFSSSILIHRLEPAGWFFYFLIM